MQYCNKLVLYGDLLGHGVFICKGIVTFHLRLTYIHALLVKRYSTNVMVIKIRCVKCMQQHYYSIFPILPQCHSCLILYLCSIRQDWYSSCFQHSSLRVYYYCYDWIDFDLHCKCPHRGYGGGIKADKSWQGGGGTKTWKFCKLPLWITSNDCIHLPLMRQLNYTHINNINSGSSMYLNATLFSYKSYILFWKYVVIFAYLSQH